jgi:cold shock CspA family protein
LGEHTRGTVRKATAARKVPAGRPAEPEGTPRSGRIVALVLGQGHGFIRLTDGRKVFFHRSDLPEGKSFSEFEVGDSVVFELLEDPISGPRARNVQRRRPRR